MMTRISLFIPEELPVLARDADF